MTLVEANSATPLADVDSLLLDHVHAGVCVIRSTRFMYVNRCLAGMLGYDIAHMLSGMAAIDIVHPEDRPIVLEKIRRRDEGEITAPYDIRLVGNKGRLLHARVCGVYITFGGARANVVTMTDISEVKRALHAADWQARMLALTEDLCLGASMEIEAHSTHGPAIGSGSSPRRRVRHPSGSPSPTRTCARSDARSTDAVVAEISASRGPFGHQTLCAHGLRCSCRSLQHGRRR